MNFIMKVEIKMKFKVGQKVKVKNFYDIAGTFTAPHKARGVMFPKEMVDFCGKVFTIAID